MARHDSRRDMKQAYGRYSGSDQGDDHRRDERREHGVYGFGAAEGPGYDREDWNGGRYGVERTVEHDDSYYDPDHVYRAHDRFNSGYGGDHYGRREFGPVHNDRLGGGRNARENWPADDGYAWRVNHGYRGAGGYRSPPHDGGHRGRGPKGYARSDDRIREDVCDCLTYDPHIDASNIEVLVRGGEVTLTGRIDSRNARRHAEDLAERAMGVKHVQNNLRVSDKETSDIAATPLFSRTGTDKR